MATGPKGDKTARSVIGAAVFTFCRLSVQGRVPQAVIFRQVT